MSTVWSASFGIGRCPIARRSSASTGASSNAFRARHATIRIGFIVVTADLFDEALSLAAADPAAIVDLNHEIALDDPSVVRRAKDEGVEVVTWTVNEPDEATRLRRAGVTGFTTDHVDRLLEWAGQESGQKGDR